MADSPTFPVGAWVTVRPACWTAHRIYTHRTASPYGRVTAAKTPVDRRVVFRRYPWIGQDVRDPPGLDGFDFHIGDLCPAVLPDDEALAWLLLELGGSDAHEG